MRTPPGPDPDLTTVLAARAGDRAALDALAAAYLPLVYNVVGRALDGHPDTDDVVQETMFRALRGLGELRDPAAFRSWLVAIAVRQVRDSYRDRLARPPVLEAPVVEGAAPLPDFADLTIDRLGLSGQRRQAAEATRWLDDDDRPVLALWWQEAAGQLDRAELAAGLGLTPAHAAVRVARMKERLATSRLVVHALRRAPQCGELAGLTGRWDGEPSPLWRKRLARHVRDCPSCGAGTDGLIPAERLLAGLPLVAVPAGLAGLGGLAGLARGVAGHALDQQTATAPGWRPVRPRARTLRHARHARVLAKGAAAVPPKLVAVAVAVATVAAGGTFAVAQAHRAPGGPARPAPAAASELAASPLPLATGAAHLKPAHPARRAPAPSRSASPGPSRTVPAKTVPATPAPASTSAPAGPAATSQRKGVSVWSFPGEAQALADSGASWYYNWGATPGGLSAPGDVSYVPMIWGAANVTSATLAQVRQEGSTLLGFNEPDQGGQANMTVAQALGLWPQLEATGMTLGSPAVSAGAATPGGWLDQFMAGAKARGYRVDFITLHWYGGDFVTADAVRQLRSYVAAVYARYHRPIWVTEFALTDFGSATPAYPTQAGQAAFLTAATEMLDGLSYVQRYAWFALPTSAGSGTTGLFGPGPSVTPVGRAFEQAR